MYSFLFLSLRPHRATSLELPFARGYRTCHDMADKATTFLPLLNPSSLPVPCELTAQPIAEYQDRERMGHSHHRTRTYRRQLSPSPSAVPQFRVLMSVEDRSRLRLPRSRPPLHSFDFP